MVIAGIHVHQPQPRRRQVVAPLPGEAPVGHAGVCPRRLHQECPKRVIERVAAAHQPAAGIAHGHHAAQAVGVQGVERYRRAGFDPLGHDLTVGAEGHALGAAARGRNFLLIVGEGGVGAARFHSVRLAGGQNPVAVDVVLSC